MKKKSNHYLFINNVIIGMLILNLFIFTSSIRFLPWFIEDGWGTLGLLLTSFVLLITFFKSYQLHKKWRENYFTDFYPACFCNVFILRYVNLK